MVQELWKVFPANFGICGNIRLESKKAMFTNLGRYRKLQNFQIGIHIFLSYLQIKISRALFKMFDRILCKLKLIRARWSWNLESNFEKS